MLLIKRRLPDYVYWRPQSRPRDGRLALDGVVVEDDRPPGFKAPIGFVLAGGGNPGTAAVH